MITSDMINHDSGVSVVITMFSTVLWVWMIVVVVSLMKALCSLPPEVNRHV